jgi:hypothetical protein
MRVLRTPEERFADLPDFAHEPRYAEVPDLNGGVLRMAYLEAGPADPPWCSACTASRVGPSCTDTCCGC